MAGITQEPSRIKLDSDECWESRHTLMQSSTRQARSEEHTSELQSLTNLVCRLLLEKKKKKNENTKKLTINGEMLSYDDYVSQNDSYLCRSDAQVRQLHSDICLTAPEPATVTFSVT